MSLTRSNFPEFVVHNIHTFPVGASPRANELVRYMVGVRVVQH